MESRIGTAGIVSYCIVIIAVAYSYILPSLVEIPVSESGLFCILALLGSLVGPVAASPEPEVIYGKCPIKR